MARQALLNYSALAGEDPDARRRAGIAVRIADLSLRMNDFPLAATWYERAAPSLSADEGFVLKHAEARWRAGQPDAARAMLDKLIEKNPANAAAIDLRRRVR